jgi:hypothetical protein
LSNDNHRAAHPEGRNFPLSLSDIKRNSECNKKNVENFHEKGEARADLWCIIEKSEARKREKINLTRHLERGTRLRFMRVKMPRH